MELQRDYRQERKKKAKEMQCKNYVKTYAIPTATEACNMSYDQCLRKEVQKCQIWSN